MANLLAHIKAINAKSTTPFPVTENLEYWENRGITTADQLDGYLKEAAALEQRREKCVDQALEVLESDFGHLLPESDSR